MADNTLIITVALGIFAILVYFLFFKKSAKPSKKNKTLNLFCGPVDSGKTAALLHLQHGKDACKTVASMECNSAKVKVDEGGDVTANIVDVPGHPRIRPQLMKELDAAKGVVVFLDATCFAGMARTDVDKSQRKEEGIQILYDVLTHTEFSNFPGGRVLVACNKMDLFDDSVLTAPTAKSIKKEVEKELNIIRESRQGMLQTTDGADQEAFLGEEGKKFKMEDSTVPVEFKEVSVSAGDVQPLRDFLA